MKPWQKNSQKWWRRYFAFCPKPEQQPFIDLVDKILNHKQQTIDTRALETQIDQMVYKLYNLTEDEIKIIEDAK